MPEDANADEIKAAFRRKAKLLHPDTGAPESNAFLELREAYEKLLEKSASQNPEAKIAEVPPLTMIFGGAFALNRETSEVCNACSAKGYLIPDGAQQCFVCSGKGQVFFPADGANGRICFRCSGHGFLGAETCNECNGRGHKNTLVAVTANVPPGTLPGMKLRVDGATYKVRAAYDEHMKQVNGGFRMKVPVNPTQATCGSIIRMKLSDVNVVLKMEPGTQNGDELNMIEPKGIKGLSFEASIEIPRSVSPSLHTSMIALEKSLDLYCYPVKRSWLERFSAAEEYPES